MRSVELVISNPSGLHARPATLFTEAAAGFASKITVENLSRGKGPVDAKSTLMLLTAGVSRDHRIRLVADGPDEDAAIDALVGLVTSGLGEPPAELIRRRARHDGAPSREQAFEAGPNRGCGRLVKSAASPPTRGPPDGRPGSLA